MPVALQARATELFRRLFDIRVGEMRRAMLMQVHIFLLITCLWIAKPVVTAHFLSLAGIGRLPLALLLVSLIALLVSTAYSRLLNRLPLRRMMARTYWTAILGILLFGTLMRLGLYVEWVLYPFYIGEAIFSLLITSQFWIQANLVFNRLEAKRLFGFIGAGAIAGGVGGGYVTSVLAPRTDSVNLLFLAAALLAAAWFVSRRVWAEHLPESDEAALARQSRDHHEHPIRLILRSKHLSYLAAIVGISVVVAKLVEFQFSAIASERIRDPDRLAAFFGFWFSTFNVVSLAIQLFVTNRIVGMFGVGRSLFILPGALAAGAAAVIAAPVLWAGVLLKLFDVSLKQSVNKAATELLILPVPMPAKSQAKTFIDVFVDTTATGVGGVLLIFLVNGFGLSVQAVCILILALVAVWLFFALRIRDEYLRIFQEKLGTGRERRRGLRWSDSSAVEGIRRALRDGGEKQLLFLLARIEETRDQRLIPSARPLLTHASPAVRTAALRCLYFSQDPAVIEEVKPLLRDPDEEVRFRAFSCLLALSRSDRVAIIDRYLTDADPMINGAALVGLATEARGNAEMQRVFDLYQRIRDKLEYLRLLKDPAEVAVYKGMLARAIGYGRLRDLYPVLREWFADADPEVREAAILAAGTSRDPAFVRELVNFLAQRETRPAATRALAHYEPAELLPPLERITAEPDLRPEVLAQLPELTVRMDTQRAVDFLFGLLQHRDVGVRLDALRALRRLHEAFPHLTLPARRVLALLMEEADLYRDTLALSHTARGDGGQTAPDDAAARAREDLARLLEHRLNGTLECIFRLLGLRYPPGDILPVFEGIRDRDPDMRLNAVDLLDNLLEPNLRRKLLPLVETALADTVSDEALRRLSIEAPTEVDCLRALLRGRDEKIKLAALHWMAADRRLALPELLQITLRDDSDRVREFARRMGGEGGGV